MENKVLRVKLMQKQNYISYSLNKFLISRSLFSIYKALIIIYFIFEELEKIESNCRKQNCA